MTSIGSYGRGNTRSGVRKNRKTKIVALTKGDAPEKMFISRIQDWQNLLINHNCVINAVGAGVIRPGSDRGN